MISEFNVGGPKTVTRSKSQTVSKSNVVSDAAISQVSLLSDLNLEEEASNGDREETIGGLCIR